MSVTRRVFRFKHADAVGPSGIPRAGPSGLGDEPVEQIHQPRHQDACLPQPAGATGAPRDFVLQHNMLIRRSRSHHRRRKGEPGTTGPPKK